MPDSRYSSWKVQARLWLLPLILALAACQSAPRSYSPPAQRTTLSEIPPAEPLRLIWLADPSSQAHIVRDIDRQGQTDVWYWTGPRPAVRVHIGSDARLDFSIEFLLSDEELARTGPLTISYYLDNREVGHALYSSPGHYFYEQPIPQDWIQPDRDVILSAAVDKPFLHDDKPAGFQMSSIGLLEE